VWFDVPERGLIAVQVLYSDASYNHPTEREPNPSLFYTVGSYVGHVDNWIKFRREWRAEMRTWGIEDFHANRFERSYNEVKNGRTLEASNPYVGWDVLKFEAFRGRLHKILRRKSEDGLPRLDAVGFSIKKSDFDVMLPLELKSDPGCATYYMFCVASNMQHIAMLNRHRGYEGKIHYVFASGDRGARLEEYFHGLWKDKIARAHFALSKSYTVLGYDIASASEEPALQASDLAAYEFNKLALYCDANDITDPTQIDPSVLRKSLLDLARPPLNLCPVMLSGERMRAAFDGMLEWKKKYGGRFAYV
jgi:hypothetical protein